MPTDPDNQTPQPPTPPSANPEQAEKYLDWLGDLINRDKLSVIHSDLTKFNVDCMRDHYRVDLKSYDVEISHSKHPTTGEDIFTMIFNNISNLSAGADNRVILAYIKLTGEQFNKFKTIADNQLERERRIMEEKRFKEAMEPVDQVLEQLSSGEELVESQRVTESKESEKNDILNPSEGHDSSDSTPVITPAPITPNLVKPPLPASLDASQGGPEDLPQSMDNSSQPETPQPVAI